MSFDLFNKKRPDRYLSLQMSNECPAKLSLQEINPFTYVEINGLRVQTPAHAYSLLWNGISQSAADQDRSPKYALAALERTFHRPGPGRKSWCVLLIRIIIFVC